MPSPEKRHAGQDFAVLSVFSQDEELPVAARPRSQHQVRASYTYMRRTEQVHYDRALLATVEQGVEPYHVHTTDSMMRLDIVHQYATGDVATESLEYGTEHLDELAEGELMLVTTDDYVPPVREACELTPGPDEEEGPLERSNALELVELMHDSKICIQKATQMMKKAVTMLKMLRITSSSVKSYMNNRQTWSCLRTQQTRSLKRPHCL